MSRLDHRRDLALSAWRTWGAKGLGRRSIYEATKRSGRLRSTEDAWLRATTAPGCALRPVGIAPPAQVAPADTDQVATGAALVLYGGLSVPVSEPPRWRVHPLSGHDFEGSAHWSSISDASVDAGDIKDVWELSRLGWLHPLVRSWAATGDEAIAERIWATIEDWARENPPYLGPNWMCGQETSLRTISVMFVADALDASSATTDERRLLVSRLVQDAVGRVGPTLGYALSQRNNHASSEAGFLWSASVLAPWLPGAGRLRQRASQALTEVASDQFADDGSYAQHSPTYQRVALHVLLWCLAVARSTGEPIPPGVAEAVGRSVPHLRSLQVPGTDGRAPNLGGNDGALVFDLVPAPIHDLRPVIAHAAAATDQPSGLGSGPWDDEAAWFGLAPATGDPRTCPPARNTHGLTRGTAHAVLRAGPLGHRPAHADQLHLDVWLDGLPIAVDAGSYRYTAPDPWGNALAGEAVHNLPRVPGTPQAVMAGRFFWRRWSEATVVARVDETDVAAITARLVLPGGEELTRTVAVMTGRVLIVDHTVGAEATVRWNLPLGIEVATELGRTTVVGPRWCGRLVHDGRARALVATEGDPASGWHAPTYAIREPLVPVEVEVAAGGLAVAAFGPGRAVDHLEAVVTVAPDLVAPRLDAGVVRRVLSAGA